MRPPVYTVVRGLPLAAPPVSCRHLRVAVRGNTEWQYGVSCRGYFRYSSSPAMGTRQTNRSVSLPVFTTW